MDIEHVIIVVMGYLLGRHWWRSYRRRIPRWWKHHKTRLPRRWKPKSPDDCPLCHQGLHLESAPIKHDVIPYRHRKSSRGRKKIISTQGFACLNPACEYFGIVDEQVHALVANGKRGLNHIQNLKCQWCHKTFSCRKGTPLYYLKTAEDQVEMVLWFLVEGVDISVMVRYTGRADATLARWLERMGQHSSGLHHTLFRNLTMALIQLDELYGRVRGTAKAVWLWLAIDPVSKAIPALHLGGRTGDDAYALVHDLKNHLHQDCVPAVTTDGLRSYFYALTAHFGYWFRPKRARTDHWKPHDRLLHGQLVKRRERRQVTFTITLMLWGKRRDLNTILNTHGFPSNIQTAFIERVNLTIRQGVSLLTRKTWSLAQSHQHLLLHVRWWRAYYHLVRPHASLRIPSSSGRRKYRDCTPAMALGITDHVWSVSEILRTPLVPVTTRT